MLMTYYISILPTLIREQILNIFTFFDDGDIKSSIRLQNIGSLDVDENH